MPISWNITGACAISGNAEPEDIAVNRTNNPLENFNKQLKKAFPTTPSMVHFITGIQNICKEKVDEQRLIRSSKSKPKKHASVKIRKIPADYASFVPPTTAPNDAADEFETTRKRKR